MHLSSIIIMAKKPVWIEISETKRTEAQEAKALHGIKVCLVMHKIPLCPE